MSQSFQNTFSLALFGTPIHQSQSPLLHQIIAKHVGLELLEYHLLSCDISQAQTQYQKAIELGLKGASVTIPLKEWAYEIVKSNHPHQPNHLSKLASDLKTVNALRWDENGVYGHNTDVIGFEKSLSLNSTLVHHTQDLSTYQSAVLLGAGGASRAVCYALLKMGVNQITWLCRNPDQRIKSRIFFDEICSNLSINPQSVQLKMLDFLAQNLPSQVDICVFTTPPLDLAFYQDLPFERIKNASKKQATLIYDLNYGQRAELLKQVVIQQSLEDFQYQDGLYMLCDQGISAFEWFHQIEISQTLAMQIRDEFREKVRLNSSKTMNF
jgi:shikimate dehydrogenase